VDVTLSAGADPWTALLDRVAALYVAGVEIDWAAFDAGYGRRKMALPTYPFERERYWVDLPGRDDATDETALLYTTEWREQPRSSAIDAPDETRGTWVIFGDAQDRGATLARKLEFHGHRTVLVSHADDYSALAAGGSILGVVDLRNLDINGADVAGDAVRGATATLDVM
jgi:acyl transferase domain-containing protein